MAAPTYTSNFDPRVATSSSAHNGESVRAWSAGLPTSASSTASTDPDTLLDDGDGESDMVGAEDMSAENTRPAGPRYSELKILILILIFTLSCDLGFISLLPGIHNKWGNGIG
jgi:hypothetical protein